MSSPTPAALVLPPHQGRRLRPEAAVPGVERRLGLPPSSTSTSPRARCCRLSWPPPRRSRRTAASRRSRPRRTRVARSRRPRTTAGRRACASCASTRSSRGWADEKWTVACGPRWHRRDRARSVPGPPVAASVDQLVLHLNALGPSAASETLFQFRPPRVLST